MFGVVKIKDNKGKRQGQEKLLVKRQIGWSLSMFN